MGVGGWVDECDHRGISLRKVDGASFRRRPHETEAPPRLERSGPLPIARLGARAERMVGGIVILLGAISLSTAQGSALHEMNGAPVPANLVGKTQGRWNLGEHYRITLSLKRGAFHVHQDVDMRLGKRVERDCAAEYDASSRTLSFPGVGAVHRLIVLLRWEKDGLEFSARSEKSPGHWVGGVWESAQRR